MRGPSDGEKEFSVVDRILINDSLHVGRPLYRHQLRSLSPSVVEMQQAKLRVMKNKQEFILRLEKQEAINSLNRFVDRRFDRTTQVWSSALEHNILMFVLEGEVTVSGGDSTENFSETLNHPKVALLPKNSAICAEFTPGCRVLTYSFDTLLPVDSSIYEGLQIADNKHDKLAETSIPESLLPELVNITQNIGAINSTETLAFLSIRKVIDALRKALPPTKSAELFAVGGSKLASEIGKYRRFIENRTNLTTKFVDVVF